MVDGEKWDLLDIHGCPNGRTVSRACDGNPESLLGDGDLHRLVQVVVFNSRGQVLIQLRSPDKPEWPNSWDLSAGGSVLAGESSQEGASRELLEELGIFVDFQGVRPQLVVSFPRGFFDVYVTNLECDPEQLVLQEEEVQAARWASVEEILRMIDDGSFCDVPKSLIELIGDLHARPDFLAMN